MADRDRKVCRVVTQKYLGSPGGCRPYFNIGQTLSGGRKVQVASHRMFCGPAAQSPVGPPLRKTQSLQVRSFPRTEPVVLFTHIGQRLFQPAYFHQSACRTATSFSAISERSTAFLPDRVPSSLAMPRAIAAIR